MVLGDVGGRHLPVATLRDALSIEVSPVPPTHPPDTLDIPLITPDERRPVVPAGDTVAADPHLRRRRRREGTARSNRSRASRRLNLPGLGSHPWGSAAASCHPHGTPTAPPGRHPSTYPGSLGASEESPPPIAPPSTDHLIFLPKSMSTAFHPGSSVNDASPSTRRSATSTADTPTPHITTTSAA